MNIPEDAQPSESADSPERDETIQSPHDRLLNQSLQQIDVARCCPGIRFCSLH